MATPSPAAQQPSSSFQAASGTPGGRVGKNVVGQGVPSNCLRLQVLQQDLKPFFSF